MYTCYVRSPRTYEYSFGFETSIADINIEKNVVFLFSCACRSYDKINYPHFIGLCTIIHHA